MPNQQPQNIYWKVLVLSTGIALLGFGTVAFLDWKLHNPDAKPWWYILIYGVAVHGLIPIGAIAFLFEVFIRRDLHREFTQSIRDLFSEDPSLARSLSEETRKRRVRNVLIAQLGEEGGQAVFSGMAERYLTGASPLRWNEELQVSIEDIDENIEISLPEWGTTKVTLSKDDYHRVIVKSNYEAMFDDTQRFVGCILVEDSEELNYWFKRDDCFFRDVACLNETERVGIGSLLQTRRTKNGPLTALTRGRSLEREKAELVTKFFQVDIKIDGKQFDVQRVRLSPSGKSIEIGLKDPGSIKKGTRVRFELKQVSVLAKSVRRYPVIFGEPCQNPSVTFLYPANDVTNVRESVFLTGRSPFEPAVEKRPHADYIKVGLPPSMGPLWVFPNSGVVFTWDSGQKG